MGGKHTGNCRGGGFSIMRMPPLASNSWLPVLDGFVVDVLAAALDGFDGQAVDYVEDAGGDTLCDLQDPSQRFRRKHRGSTQRRVAQDRGHQGLELFVALQPTGSR